MKKGVQWLDVTIVKHKTKLTERFENAAELVHAPNGRSRHNPTRRFNLQVALTRHNGINLKYAVKYKRINNASIFLASQPICKLAARDYPAIWARYSLKWRPYFRNCAIWTIKMWIISLFWRGGGEGGSEINVLKE
jgi:hypothetical protein